MPRVARARTGLYQVHEGARSILVERRRRAWWVAWRSSAPQPPAGAPASCSTIIPSVILAGTGHGKPEGVSIGGHNLAEASMEPSVPTPEQVLLEALRRHRAELRESMSALEQALAAPAPGRLDAWAQRVHVALVELSADFREHIDVTEGPSGLYRGLLTTAPRLSKAVARLTH